MASLSEKRITHRTTHRCVLLSFILFVGIGTFCCNISFAGNVSSAPTKTAVEAVWPLAENVAKQRPGGDVDLSSDQNGIILVFRANQEPVTTLRLLHPDQTCPDHSLGHSAVFSICSDRSPDDFFVQFAQKLQKLPLKADEAWETRAPPLQVQKDSPSLSPWPYDFVLSFAGFLVFLLFGIGSLCFYVRHQPKEFLFDSGLFLLALLVRGTLTDLEPGIYNIRLISMAQPAATCQAFNIHACGNEAWQYLVFLLGGTSVAVLGLANLLVSSLLVPLTRIATKKLFQNSAAGLAAAVFVLACPLLIRFGYTTEPISLALTLVLSALLAAQFTKKAVFSAIFASLALGLAYQIRIEMALFIPWIGFVLLRKGQKTSRWVLWPELAVLLAFVLPHLWTLSGTWQTDHADEWFVLGRQEWSWKALPALFIPAVGLETKLLPALAPLLLPVCVMLTAWKRPRWFAAILLLGATSILPYMPYGFNLSTSFGFYHYFPPYFWILCLFYASAAAILFSMFPKGSPSRSFVTWLFGLLLVLEILPIPARNFPSERTVIHEELQFIRDTSPTLDNTCTLLLPPPVSTRGPLQPHPLLFENLSSNVLRYADFQSNPDRSERCLIAYSGAICSIRHPDADAEEFCRFLERRKQLVLAEKIVPAQPVEKESYLTENIVLRFVSIRR